MRMVHEITRAAATLVGVATLLMVAACSPSPPPAPSPTSATDSSKGAPIVAAPTTAPEIAPTAIPAVVPTSTPTQAAVANSCVTCHTSAETIDRLAARKAEAPKSAEASGEG